VGLHYSAANKKGKKIVKRWDVRLIWCCLYLLCLMMLVVLIDVLMYHTYYYCHQTPRKYLLVLMYHTYYYCHQTLRGHFCEGIFC
jgi:hypothetical protein